MTYQTGQSSFLSTQLIFLVLLYKTNDQKISHLFAHK